MNLGDPISTWVVRWACGWRPIESASDLRWCVRWMRKLGSARLRLKVVDAFFTEGSCTIPF